MATMHVGSDVFESCCDMVDVTSIHRPDTSWRYVDGSGHEHVWFRDGNPATNYRPEGKHDVPSIVFVFDRWGYYEDGSRYQIGHYECRQCREHVTPGFTADAYTRYIPGMRHYRINGETVSQAEFTTRARQAGLL